MNLDTIRDLVADDLTSVDNTIETRLNSAVGLIEQMGSYIVGSGGKRVRPLLVVLAARACGYQEQGQGKEHAKLAAIVELIHTATLLHDDVVDESLLRRGRETANALWGDHASVLVGDFLYSRSFQMMTEVGRPKVMEILANTTNVISEGEVLQLVNCHDPDTTEASYLDVIHYKTAQLFEAGAQLGAVISDAAAVIEKALAQYGMHLGTAFQLIDDVLDYQSSPEDTGKNLGDDLAEGKPTLPLIHVMKHGDAEQVELVRQAIINGGRDQIKPILAAIQTTGAIDYTASVARKEADAAIEALQILPASVFRDALQGLAEFAVSRNY